MSEHRRLDVWVVGAGLMGSQIAVEYAVGGHAVCVLSRDSAATSARLDAGVATACAAGLLPESERGRTLAAIAVVAAFADRDSPDLVVESLPEDLETKAEVLLPIMATHPRTTLASNTSSLQIGHLGRRLEAEDRVLGTHYWNPPLLMPLVELVRGPATSPRRMAWMESVLRGLGKRPVLVADVPGFVWNRLQFSLLREAAWIVENGWATAEEVDLVVEEGLAIRWALTGPFTTAGLGGVGTFETIAERLLPELSRAREVTGLDRHVPSPERLTSRAARRDRELADRQRRRGADGFPHHG